MLTCVCVVCWERRMFMNGHALLFLQCLDDSENHLLFFLLLFAAPFCIFVST